jgi:NagD protein
MKHKYLHLSAISDPKILSKKLSAIKHLAMDMDGTIYFDNTLFPFTLTFLENLKSLGLSFCFLTNNPTKSTDDYLRHLLDMGIKVSKDEMITSVQATIDYLKSNFPQYKKLFILGTPSMIKEFEQAGFISTSESHTDIPDALLVSFDKTLNYKRLCTSAYWAKQNLPYIATNPDRVCPTKEQTVLVDCGSICAAIEYATGRKPDTFIGKPDPRILSSIFAKHKLNPSQIAIAGDRIYTDVKTAFNAGALSILVLSGETTIEDIKNSKLKPDIIVDKLSDLLPMLAPSS